MRRVPERNRVAHPVAVREDRAAIPTKNRIMRGHKEQWSTVAGCGPGIFSLPLPTTFGVMAGVLIASNRGRRGDRVLSGGRAVNAGCPDPGAAGRI